MLCALASALLAYVYYTNFGVRVLKPEVLMLTGWPFKTNAQLNGTVFLDQSSFMGKDGTCPVSRPIWTESVGPQSRQAGEVDTVPTVV